MAPTLKPSGNAPKTWKSMDACKGDAEKEDQYVCDKFHEIRKAVTDFAKMLTSHFIEKGNPGWKAILDDQHQELVRYINWLAMGRTQEKWKDLLQGSGRHGIMVAVLGQALKHEVFDSLYFGATHDQWQQLRASEEHMQTADGFQRAAQRARIIRGWSSGTHDSERLQRAQIRTALRLWAMMKPMCAWAFHGSEYSPDKYKKCLKELVEIVEKASTLNREMRLQEHVVYHWPGTFKDELWESRRMECLNLEETSEKSPYSQVLTKGPGWKITKLTMVWDQHEAARLNRQAVVDIVCFPGLVSYRPGGGAMALKQLQKEEKNYGPEGSGRKLDEESKKGFRNRVLAKALVSLKWGKQSLLTAEAGTSRHLDAVKNDGMSRYQQPVEQGIVPLRVMLENTKLSQSAEPGQ